MNIVIRIALLVIFTTLFMALAMLMLNEPNYGMHKYEKSNMQRSLTHEKPAPATSHDH